MNPTGKEYLDLLELRRVTIYEPPEYDYTDAELRNPGDEDNEEDNQEEMEEGEL